MPLIHPDGGSTLQTTRSHLEGREAERQDLWLRDPGDLGQVPSPSETSVSPLQRRRQAGLWTWESLYIAGCFAGEIAILGSATDLFRKPKYSLIPGSFHYS